MRHRRSWWGPCGAPASWTHGPGPYGAERGAGGEGAGEPDRAGRWMPLRGAEPLPLPVSPWLPLSPSASSFSRRGLITAGAVVAARSLWRPLSPLPAGGAQRGPAAGTGAAGGLRCGGGVVGVSTRSGKAHQASQVWGRGPGLCGSCGRWLGAGLASGDRRSPERVWTLGSVTLRSRPLESLPTALTVKGAGGEETAGANAVVGVDVGRVVAVPVGDPPSDVTVLRQWGQASAEAMGREQTLAQLEGVAMG